MPAINVKQETVAFATKVIEGFNSMTLDLLAKKYKDLPSKAKFNFHGDKYFESLYDDVAAKLWPLARTGFIGWVSRIGTPLPLEVYASNCGGLLYSLELISSAKTPINNKEQQFELIKCFLQAVIQNLNTIANAREAIITIFLSKWISKITNAPNIQPIKSTNEPGIVTIFSNSNVVVGASFDLESNEALDKERKAFEAAKENLLLEVRSLDQADSKLRASSTALSIKLQEARAKAALANSTPASVPTTPTPISITPAPAF